MDRGRLRRDADDGQLPMGKPTDEWSYGDVEAASRTPRSCSTRRSSRQNTSHQPLEPRTAMAYWQNGKLYLHARRRARCRPSPPSRGGSASSRRTSCSSASTPAAASAARIPGRIAMAIPALLSKKANAPVMMRITREEEHYIGRARPGAARARRRSASARTAASPRSTCFVVGDNGPYDAGGDDRSAGDMVSLLYQPKAMRWRGVDGADQHAAARRAARAGRHAGQRARWSRCSPRRRASSASIRSRSTGSTRRRARRSSAPPNARGQRQYATSAFVKEALDKGAELFNWDEQKARSGKRVGTKVRGVGVAVSAYSAGSIGLRRPVHHQAGRPRADPVGHRQPRHASVIRRASRRRRDDRRAVGEVRRRLGQHEQEPAVDLRLGRQPDDARDDARGARRRHRRHEEAAGDRREDARRQARRATRSPTSACRAAAAA